MATELKCNNNHSLDSLFLLLFDFLAIRDTIFSLRWI